MRRRILISSRLPWDDIKSPVSDLHLLRIDAVHPQDFSWGKDSAGRLLLVLKLPQIENLSKQNISLTGITADICKVDSNKEVYFQLALESHENADIFHTLCNDLIEKTRNVISAETALSLIYSRLERWRILLSKANRRLLSSQEVQGLFGELKFLEECIGSDYLSMRAAIDGWKGPLGAPHDFIFDQAAVEIKSIGGSSIHSVRISSESQLTTHLSTLHLRLIFLAQDADCARGVSLNTLVKELKNRIKTHDLIEALDERLFETGYIDIPEYDHPCFSVTQSRMYHVREGFPRITPDSLPIGISEVSYCIAFSSIAEYLCDSLILKSS
jgi:putative PD-(D/E)XK family protein DUF4420